MRAKILVVDDEESIRYSFETFLKNEGYEVACAPDLDAGLSLVASQVPDLIFSDIILKDDNGLKLLEKVNELGLFSPVIMITGQPSIDTAAEAVRLGAYDYMVKPIVKESLLRVCRTALKAKQLMDEREQIRAEKNHYRNHLEAVFASVDDAIITIDNARKIIACNNAALNICRAKDAGDPEVKDPYTKNQDAAALTGLRISESRNPLLSACRETIERVLDTKETVKHRKKTFTDARGNNCVISVSCSPLLSRHKKSIGAALVVKDTTRIHFLENRLREAGEFKQIIGNSYRMDKVFDLVRALADTDATVLITGESGTGKSLVAREIHALSGRSGHNMVTVRCSALAEQLLESELFGHVKGAFTGAISDKVGRFEMCNKGSIFLDEIGEISPVLQLKLLSVIQDREFERVGDSRPVKVDTRIIAATNRQLKEEVSNGNFREDLYYRLNVVEIKMPPLRERHGDIPLLVAHFLNHFQKKYNKSIQAVSAEVIKLFTSYPWPGNVRELEHAIEHGFVLCREDIIDIPHIPSEIIGFNRPAGSVPGNGPRTETEEKHELISILEKTDWNKAKAARMLGVSRPTLYRKLERFGLEQEN
ncbi:MAG TPA: sigma-54-dependent Fis family transcriptional regulator [Desulfobacteraceae bacterium]|nr:sigma-54-dependent Fis family transcriptional regulator [Desulfobacteraceae bacterium]